MTLSKEMLNKIASWSEAYDNVVLPAEEAKALAAELLERRERDKQEPVISVIFKDGWPIPETVGIVAGSEKLPDGAHEFYAAQPAPVATAMTRDKIREIFMNNGFTIKAGQTDLKEYVYAAASELISFVKAPAPVVPPLQVPDAISVREAIANMESHEYCDTINVAYRHGWNDCRAAMLQSFGNSEQLNSPVIPDGWVAVPVKPTKEMLGQIHLITEADCPDCGKRVTADCEDNVLMSWQEMLAAAPKQESE